MAHILPETIVDIVLARRAVYGLECDSRIRQAANQLTAGALFELLGSVDDEAADFTDQLSALLADCGEGVSGLIGFDTGDLRVDGERPEEPQLHEEAAEFYLRLVHRDEDAAYYQFHLFPDLEADYVLGAARKRAGAVQHLRLELSRPEALQWFIESCRSNPHFLRVEESTAEEFQRAPSDGV